MKIEKKSIQNTLKYSWGIQCEGWPLLNHPGLSVKEESIPPGAGENWHGHLLANQFFYVLQGEATFETDEQMITIGINEGIHIPDKKIHRVINKHSGELKLLLATAPCSASDRIDLVQYDTSLKEPFKKLNMDWIGKYFTVETLDELLLENPEEQILNKGGFIFGAKRQDQVIGVVALLRVDNDAFELAKMAVSETERGTGIGHLLMDFTILKARELGIKKLILYSNTILNSAIHLYRKFDFVEVPLASTLYKRSNIKMEKTI